MLQHTTGNVIIFLKLKKLMKSRSEGKMRKKLRINRGITLIAFAISRKCVRYEERA